MQPGPVAAQIGALRATGLSGLGRTAAASYGACSFRGIGVCVPERVPDDQTLYGWPWHLASISAAPLSAAGCCHVGLRGAVRGWRLSGTWGWYAMRPAGLGQGGTCGIPAAALPVHGWAMVFTSSDANRRHRAVPGGGGRASALSGFFPSRCVAFGVGAWLGWRIDGHSVPAGQRLWFWTAVIAFLPVLVQRFGDAESPAPAGEQHHDLQPCAWPGPPHQAKLRRRWPLRSAGRWKSSASIRPLVYPRHGHQHRQAGCGQAGGSAAPLDQHPATRCGPTARPRVRARRHA